MKKIVLIPDSFKGTISSTEICEIMQEQVKKYYPAAEVVAVPVADGGEGSVECFLAAMGGQMVRLHVQGPYGQEMEAFYGLVDDGTTAIVEMAACAGLPLVEDNKNPAKTSTFGVGQLMAHAAKSGCKKIIVGIGGSCTNDMGAGAAAALGYRFYDKAGKAFVPVGGSLADVAKIEKTQELKALDGVEMVAMCDIDNPLYGPQGAAHVFAPQKGADPDMVEMLDEQLRALAETLKRELGVDVADMAGAGAAGGMGGGMSAFFGAKLQMGIETVLDTVNFDSLIKDADMIFTGEGKIDSQSLRGKVVIGVARRAKAKGRPVVAFVGDIGDEIEKVYDEGVSAIFSTNRVAVPFNEAKSRSKSDLALTVDNVLRFIKGG